MFNIVLFIIGTITFFLVLYSVVKAAVKNAILEAKKEMDSSKN